MSYAQYINDDTQMWRDCEKSVDQIIWMAQGRKSLANYKTVKHTVKYLRHAPDTAAVLAVLKGAPNGVIQAIANAALNARQ
jgi:hypothetical protein